MIHFRKVLDNLDVWPLLDQLAEHPELWDTDDIRARVGNDIHYQTSDIILRYNKSPDWNKPPLFVLTASHPIIDALMQAVQGEVLGKVVITKLPIGKSIERHIDLMPFGMKPVYQRFQIPLSVHPGCVFQCGDEELYMEPGSIWHFNNQVEHAVHNHSNYDRISMYADVKLAEGHKYFQSS